MDNYKSVYSIEADNERLGYRVITNSGDIQFYTKQDIKEGLDHKNKGWADEASKIKVYRELYHELQGHSGRIGIISYNRVGLSGNTDMYVLYRGLAFYNFPCINFYYGDSNTIRAKLRLGYDRDRGWCLALFQFPGIQSKLAVGAMGDIRKFLESCIILDSDDNIYGHCNGTGNGTERLKVIYRINEIEVVSTDEYRNQLLGIVQSGTVTEQIKEDYNL